MKIYENNVFRYGVTVFDTEDRYMHSIYGDPKIWGVNLKQLYNWVDSTITHDYRVYGIPKLGYELRFREKEHAMWFIVGKGRYVT